MRCWIPSERRHGDTAEVSYLVGWWLWDKGHPKPDSESDPVSDSTEHARRFDTLPEAREFARKKANEITRNESGPWYLAQIEYQVLVRIEHDVYEWETGDDGCDIEQVIASDRIKPKK